MPERFIESYEIGGFACLKQVRGPLTPLHAFIGPNDSGKSTLLRALRTALHLTTGEFERNRSGVIRPFDPGTIVKGTSIAIRFNEPNSTEYRITAAFGVALEESLSAPSMAPRIFHRHWLLTADDEPTEEEPVGTDDDADPQGGWRPRTRHWVESESRFVHFVPSALRRSSELIPEDAPLTDEWGSSLPGIYDLLFNRGDDSVRRITSEVRRLFPTVKHVRLRNPTRTTKALEVELTSGEKVPAAFLSEGLLFYLAYAALQHLDPVALLLVEEPENGLHPSRIADVMRILREISQTTQVVMATHSPLVINEMKGDEVTLVTRDPEKGTQVRLLSDTPHFAERSQVYALGELWLSYANGVDEAPLLRDGETP